MEKETEEKIFSDMELRYRHYRKQKGKSAFLKYFVFNKYLACFVVFAIIIVLFFVKFMVDYNNKKKPVNNETKENKVKNYQQLVKKILKENNLKEIIFLYRRLIRLGYENNITLSDIEYDKKEYLIFLQKCASYYVLQKSDNIIPFLSSGKKLDAKNFKKGLWNFKKDICFIAIRTNKDICLNKFEIALVDNYLLVNKFQVK